MWNIEWKSTKLESTEQLWGSGQYHFGRSVSDLARACLLDGRRGLRPPTRPAVITDDEVDDIIKEHQRERARRGGAARAAKLSPERKREIAQKAARAPRGRARSAT